MIVSMSVKFELPLGTNQDLTAGNVKKWISQLPDDALLFPIMRQTGHQRDPISVLVGLHAKWSEER